MKLILNKLKWLAILIVSVAILSTTSRAAEYTSSNSMEKRVTRLEKIAQNPVLLKVIQRLERQELELQKMHDTIEVLQHNLQKFQQKQAQNFQETDERINNLETGNKHSKRSNKRTINKKDTVLIKPKVEDPSDEEKLTKLPKSKFSERSDYKKAFKLIKQKKYDKSIKLFQKFQKDYPKSNLSSNAAYWEGEIAILQKDNFLALKAFGTVITKYPNSTKMPDAMLRKASTLYLLKRVPQSENLYNTLIKKFPKSKAANVARRILKERKIQK